MKTFSKIIPLLLILAFASGKVAAQANVDVSARVLAPLVLTPTDVALGDVAVNTAAVIAANANDTPSSNVGLSGSTANAGALQIQGQAGNSVTVSFTNAILTDGGGLNPLAFTVRVFNGASQLTSGNSVTVTSGDITLDIGGTLAASANAGTFNTSNGGTATPIAFTVVYN